MHSSRHHWLQKCTRGCNTRTDISKWDWRTLCWALVQVQKGLVCTAVVLCNRIQANVSLNEGAASQSSDGWRHSSHLWAFLRLFRPWSRGAFSSASMHGSMLLNPHQLFTCSGNTHHSSAHQHPVQQPPFRRMVPKNWNQYRMSAISRVVILAWKSLHAWSQEQILKNKKIR